MPTQKAQSIPDPSQPQTQPLCVHCKQLQISGFSYHPLEMERMGIQETQHPSGDGCLVRLPDNTQRVRVVSTDGTVQATMYFWKKILVYVFVIRDQKEDGNLRSLCNIPYPRNSPNGWKYPPELVTLLYPSARRHYGIDQQLLQSNCF